MSEVAYLGFDGGSEQQFGRRTIVWGKSGLCVALLAVPQCSVIGRGVGTFSRHRGGSGPHDSPNDETTTTPHRSTLSFVIPNSGYVSPDGMLHSSLTNAGQTASLEIIPSGSW